MKVPLSAISITTAATAASTYEPKSVLDLRGSPSPTSEKPDPNTNILSDPIQLQDDHILLNYPQLENWEHSLITPFTPHYPNLPDELIPTNFGLSDVTLISNPDIFSEENIDLNNWNVEFEYINELVQLSECIETGSIELGRVILGRLNQRLRAPIGAPIQRSAFYFKEAIQSMLNESSTSRLGALGIVQAIKARESFSGISPITMFGNFTANQAVLEAVEGGSGDVHVIDFDVGYGGHWASLMKEMADKGGPAAAAPRLRISAVVPEEYAAESGLIRENSIQFAREMKIEFEIEFLSVRDFEILSFDAVRFVEGEKVAVILSPAIFRRIGAGFLDDLRRVSPRVVVHVDAEGGAGLGTASYRQAVIDGMDFYSTVLESLEAAAGGGGGGGDEGMRRIETFVIYPKIVEAVAAAGRRGTPPCREAMVAAGLRPVVLSQFADIQAEFLLRRWQIRGFHVAKREAEMLLCWQGRPLVATSAWRY